MKRLIGFKGVVLMSLFLFAIKTSYGQLIISQYYEGASNDKCIEIYNTTSAPINLTGFSLQFFFNGSSTASTTIALSGTIGACGTWVVCDDNSNATLLGVANQVSNASFYNGDDAVALFNGGTMLDLFGNIGCDPGTEWGSAPGTADGNYIRTASYCSGVTSDDASSCPFATLTAANWTSVSLTGTANLGSHTSTCCGCSGPVAQPTTETTADIAIPGCTGATISWTASTTADNVIVVVSTGAIGSTPTDGTAYTANANYGSGETIGANQYVVYNGSGTSVSITGLTSGTTYNYAIFGYDGAITDCEENYLTGGNFGSFTTLSSCDQAQITSLMVNSCNGTSEGTDELIVIENGDSPINVDDMVIDLPNTTWCNSGCGGNTIVNNATYLADLNAMAGCSPDLFVYSTTIPADATIIIFTGDPPSSVLDYSANCGAPGAPIYVLFLNNNSITGNFANSDPDPKVTTIDFGNGDIETVTYIPDDVDNVDGGSVLFDDAGNPSYYTSTDCVYPLSLRFIEFDIHWKEDKTHINWSAYHLENGNHYLIEYSVDGINFFPIGELNQMPSSDELNNYNFTDQNAPNTSQVYYRISLTDIYGKKIFSLNAVVYPNLDFVFYADGFLNFNFEEMYHQNYTVNIYSVNGELIEKFQVQNSTSLPFNNEGVFIIEIVEKGTRQKIVTF